MHWMGKKSIIYPGNEANFKHEKTTQMSQQEQNRKLMRSTVNVAVPTMLSRVFGYTRDMIQAFFLGTSHSMDAWYIAFVIPNLLRRLFGEGAMTAAFVPVFTQLKKEKTKDEIWKFANCFFYDLTMLMVIFTLTGIAFAPLLVKIIAPGYGEIPGKWELTIVLTRIMFPYMFLISLAALAMAILNSYRKFFIPAFTPVLFNLSIITAAVLFARRAEEPAYVFAVGVVIGGALQLAIQIPSLWKQGMRFKFGMSFRHPAVRKVARLMVPGIFGVGVIQINFMLSRMIASFLEEGSVSSLVYGTRVQELALGVFSIAFSIALLPTFSEQAARDDLMSMKNTLSFSMRMVNFITFPALVGLVLLNRPIIQVLFERGKFTPESTVMTASCLLFLAFGLPFISYVKILAPAFYALKDTKTPVIVAFFVMLGYIGLSVILMGPMRVSGIALALTISSVFNSICLFWLLKRKIGKFKEKGLLVSALKSGISSVGMGAGLWILLRLFDLSAMVFIQRLGFLILTVLFGIAVYIVLSRVFNRDELESVRGLLSRKKKERS